MDLTYNDYSISSVFDDVSEELRHEVVEFWIRNQAIPDTEEAWRRTKELVFVIRKPIR